MADRPILFSAPMVRAILREIEQPGTGKTQTRRVLKPQPTPIGSNGAWAWEGRNGAFVGAQGTHIEGFPETAARHLRIRPSDRLWVRESGLEHRRVRLFTHDATPGRWWTDKDGGRYGASYGAGVTRQSLLHDHRVRPSIHMPRWASRLTLYVTEVRVERLQDISEADALAEGMKARQDSWFPVIDERRGLAGAAPDARSSYAMLWDVINGKGAWESNPWVAAYTFKPVLANIDASQAQAGERA